MESTMTDKKRGAPRRNKNAFKHGFYCRDFSSLETQDLDSALREGLQDEIAMLRVSLRRLFRLSEQAEDFENAARVLTSLSRASGQLANLLRTHKQLTGTSRTTDEAINTAIDQIVLELVK